MNLLADCCCIRLDACQRWEGGGAGAQSFQQLWMRVVGDSLRRPDNGFPEISD